MTSELFEDITRKTDLIFALAIIQEGLIKDIEQSTRGRFRFDYKHKIGIIKKNAEELRALINRLSPGQAEGIGVKSDEIEEILLKYVKQLN